MSIIHEALKKSGRPILTEGQKPVQDTKPAFRPELIKMKSRSNLGSFVALGVLLLVGAPILAPLLSGPGKNAANEISAGTPLPAASGNMKRQFAVEEAPLPMLPSLARATSGRAPRFTLSGLVYSNEDSYCLINGKVVRIGERVGDATLIQVTPAGAVLDQNGTKIALAANEG